MAIPEVSRPAARRPNGLLVRRSRRFGCMACSGDIPVGDAIDNVAFHRTCLVLHERPPLLVAGYSALAVGRTMAAVVDAPVSVPRHAAMRRPFRTARLLRSSGLPH